MVPQVTAGRGTSRPKRQHTVPRFILGNFVDDDGMLQCFDRKRGRSYVAAPENALVESHTYTLRSLGGGESFAAEEALSGLESDSAGVIERIVANARVGRVPALSTGEKDLLDRFVLVQFRRSVERLSSLKAGDGDQIVEEAIADIERAVPGRDVRGTVAQIGLDRVFKNAWITSLAYEEPDWLPTKGLAVLYSPPKNGSLLIGSDPVLLAGDDRRKPDGEFIVPVSSDVAISLALARGQERLYTDDRRLKLVRMINSHVFRQSNIVAAASRHTLNGLVAAFQKRQRRQVGHARRS